MPSPILSTKLYIPSLRPNLVERSRLIDRLENGIRQGSRFTLVSAPAGFGKTTLVSEWIRKDPGRQPVAWISLDEADNDFAQFIRYLVAALQQIDREFGQTIQPALISLQLPPVNELVTLLVNEITRSEKKFFLVLDDYHQITSQEIHQVVQLLLERQPGALHMVILTREDPPFPLPRMRVRGQMTEIRERDLRFSQLEAEDFFAFSMGLDLTLDTISVLETRTEGWIAGLQLAALAIQNYPDDQRIHHFLRTFAGTDRHILDYLVEEVYTRQTPEIQEFLLRTSILERFCAPLCDALLENSEPPNDGSAHLSPSIPFLQKIERSNLFLIPLDNQRNWYRYHHLFADLLQHLLLEHFGSQIPALHRQASLWFEAHHYLQEAVSHALKTKDWEFAAELVERHAMDLIVLSQVSTLHGWCAAFPEQVIRSRPGLGIFLAWCLVLTFRADFRESVETRLQQAEQALENPALPAHANLGPGGLRAPLRDWAVGHICAIRSQLLLAAMHDLVDPQDLIDLSIKSLKLLPEVEKPIRATSAINLAHAYLMLSDIPKAEIAFSNAMKLAWDGGNYFTAVTVFFYRARMAFLQGRLRQAGEICQEGLAQLAPKFEHPDQDFPAIRSLYVMQGVVQLEWNQVEEAGRLLSLGANLTSWAPWVELIGYTALVRLWGMQGNQAKVMEVLEQMKKVGLQHAICSEALRIQYEVTHFPEDGAIRAAAEAWSSANAQDLNLKMVTHGIGPYQVDAGYIVYRAWLYIQIALGHCEAALDYLRPVLAAAQEKGLHQRRIELSIIQALALASSGDREGAVKGLRGILPLAEAGGFRRIFDQGPLLDDLLMRAAQDDRSRGYVEQLLLDFGRLPARALQMGTTRQPHPEAPLSPSVPAYPACSEPLSDREMEVLQLIAAGYSNEEIGQRLYIAHSTVKRHINHIYGKLGVKSRTQAVLVARKFGLLR